MTLPRLLAKERVDFSEPNPYGIFDEADNGDLLEIVAVDPESTTDPAIRELLDGRLEASVTERCHFCGVKASPMNAIGYLEMWHLGWCPLSEDALRRLLKMRYGTGEN
jgi:hypothetical protein